MEEGEDAMAADGEPLKVGVKFDQPLFGVNTPDGVVGFDAEIANLIGEKLGRPVEFQEAVSANRESFLENGTVDMVVATYTINDERDEVVDFAGPYYVAGQDILVLADNPKGIDRDREPQLRRHCNTCTVEGSTSLDNLNEMAPDANVSAPSTPTASVHRRHGPGTGRRGHHGQRHPARSGRWSPMATRTTLVENPFTEEPYGIGVPEGSDLRCQINAILANHAYADGTWASDLRGHRWCGCVGDARPARPQQRRLLI